MAASIFEHVAFLPKALSKVDDSSMMINPSLFEAFLKCPTKCRPRFTGEAPTVNPHAGWTRIENESDRVAGPFRLLACTLRR